MYYTYVMHDIKFDVPYNWDTKLIDFYILHKDHIEMVYGRAEDWYPQWRKTSNWPIISLDNIFEQNYKLQKEWILFNYLLNWSSHWNQEYDREYRTKFLNHIKCLRDNWIKLVTIWNLFLLEAVINEVPWINVAASIILEIDNLTKLKTIHRLWVNYIFLSKVLLKNFNALKNINQFNKKNPKLKLFLLANDPCLNHCAYTDYHNETLSLLTWYNKQCNSFCRMQCTRKFTTDPSAIISASFIRPEDLQLYKSIWYNLIKLCDRKQSTERIIKMFNAYTNESYEWYLFDIMAPWSKHEWVYPDPIKLTEWDFIQNWLGQYRDYLRFSPKIINKDLNWYLNFWLQNKPNWCSNEDCDSCWYCKMLASKVLKSNLDIVRDNLNYWIKSCFK